MKDYSLTKCYCNSDNCQGYIQNDNNQNIYHSKSDDIKRNNPMNYVLLRKIYKILPPVVPMPFYNIVHSCYIDSALQMLFLVPSLFSSLEQNPLINNYRNLVQEHLLTLYNIYTSNETQLHCRTSKILVDYLNLYLEIEEKYTPKNIVFLYKEIHINF